MTPDTRLDAAIALARRLTQNPRAVVNALTSVLSKEAAPCAPAA